MDKILLIDADSLCFHAKDVSYTQAVETLERKIDNIIRFSGCRKYEIYLTIGRNFRFNLLPSYKENRKKQERPAYVKQLKQHLVDNYVAIYDETLEADDLVIDKFNSDRDKYIVASIDKDLLYNHSGCHINLYNLSWVTVTDEEAYNHFYKQVIIGDTVDNIPSLCKGLGEARIKKMVKDSGLSIFDVAQYLCNKLEFCFILRHQLLTCGKLDIDSIDIKTYEANDDIDYILNPLLGIKNVYKKDKGYSQSYSLSKKIDRFNNIDIKTYKIDFGKYKGLTFPELYKEDVGYFTWLYRETKDSELKYIMSKII